jgi:hypothetical protein
MIRKVVVAAQDEVRSPSADFILTKTSLVPAHINNEMVIALTIIRVAY